MAASLEHRKRMLRHLESTVESAMRSSSLFKGYPTATTFQSMAEDRSALPSHAQPAATSDASDRGLSPGEQLALLSIRRSALSREVIAKLKASTVRASGKDYAAIIAKGLAMRHGSNKFLIVTYIGKVAADAIAQALAKDLNLHFFFVGHSRLHNWIKCTCGFSHHFTATLHHVRAAQAHWMARHLREVGVDKASVVAGSVASTNKHPEENGSGTTERRQDHRSQARAEQTADARGRHSSTEV